MNIGYIFIWMNMDTTPVYHCTMKVYMHVGKGLHAADIHSMLKEQ